MKNGHPGKVQRSNRDPPDVMSSIWVFFFFAVGHPRSCLCRTCVLGCSYFSSTVDRFFILFSWFSHVHVQPVLTLACLPLPLLFSLSSNAQRKQTDPGDIAKIREAVKENKEACLCLLNYKKDGSTFHNQFFLTPLFDEAGTLVSEKIVPFFDRSAFWRPGVPFAAMTS